VALCGAIANHNDVDHAVGPRNYGNLITRRATMRGFLVLDYLARAPEAIRDLAAWAAAGTLKDRIDVVEGLENAVDALRRLFVGENLGKQLVKIAEPPIPR